MFYHLQILRRLPLPNIFPKRGFATSPKTRAARDAISPNGIAPLFCFFLYEALLYLPPMYQTPFFTDCFPLLIPKSLHHFDLSHKFCVLKLIRSLKRHISTLRERVRPYSDPQFKSSCFFKCDLQVYFWVVSF